LKNWLQTQK
jgi:hypothetical protein